MITRAQVRGKSYRKLGRGQHPNISPLTPVATHSGSTAILTFPRPVVIRGPVSLTVESRTFVSQELTSPTVLTITYNGATTGMDYELPANDPNIRGALGESNAAVAGTFP